MLVTGGCVVVAGGSVGLVEGVDVITVLLGGSVGITSTSSSVAWRRFCRVAPTASSRSISACVSVSRRTCDMLRVGTVGGTVGQVTTGGGMVVAVVGGFVVVVTGAVVVEVVEVVVVVVATVVSEGREQERKRKQKGVCVEGGKE